MIIRVFIALLGCRLVRFALRVLGRGGTALPGRVALKLYPGILAYLSRGVSTVLVTGTNGKTTCCRIIERALETDALPYFANRSGANLIQGIASEFAMNADLLGRPKNKYAVIECDEGASKQVCRSVSPAVILVTNVFSDQLDRFGDVLTTLASIRAGIEAAPDATVCLNADCSMSVALSREIKNPVLFFGVDTEIYKTRAREVSDAVTCPYCGEAFVYDYTTYGHLGGFRCPKCGFARPEPDVSVTRLLSLSPDGSQIELRMRDELHPVSMAVPGGYNIYNAAASAAACLALGLHPDTAAEAIATFKCGFGRMESYDLGGVPARMILVKNPAGCNQTLNYLSNLTGEALFVICLNDNTGDGCDISWIWDVDFELLPTMGDRLRGVICSGIRADEMAMRLRYAGLPASKLSVTRDYGELIEAMSSQDAPVVMMPTYSAMMELRSRLAAKLNLRDFWE